MDPITAAEDHGTRQYLGHFAGKTGRWSREEKYGAPEEAPEQQSSDRVAREPARRDGTKAVLGFFAVGTRWEKPTAECPVEVGQEIRFKPAAYFNGSAGLGMELDVIVTATVIQIHAEHRWYRAEWRTPGGRILRESFKY